jgi:hypothetical protein
MTMIQYVRASCLTAAVLVCTLIGGAAHAAVTTDRPGSILIFPKVVTTGTRDTVIQITNTSNMPDILRCFYLNGDTCSPNDFEIELTKQQPTEWDARSGRRVNPTDSQTGLDPGLIPPLPANFEGALICAEVDGSDVPINHNGVKGEATLVDRSGSVTRNAVSKYNAVAVQALAPSNCTPGSSCKLSLDDTEYSACPASLIVNLNRQGPDQVIEEFGNGGRCVGGANAGAACNNNNDCASLNCSTGQSRVETRLTVVPCSLDFEGLTKSNFKLAFEVEDEDETMVSPGNGPFGCWGSFVLSQSLVGLNATPYMTAAMKSSVDTGPPAPVVGVAETFYGDSVANTASAATNLHTIGVCSNTAQFATCMRDVDCASTTGPCVYSTASTIQLSATP